MGRRRLGIFGKRSGEDTAERPAPAETLASADDDFAPPEAAGADLPAPPASEPEEWTVNGVSHVRSAVAAPTQDSFEAEGGSSALPAPPQAAEQWLPQPGPGAPAPSTTPAPSETARADTALQEIEALERALAAAKSRLAAEQRERHEAEERAQRAERQARELQAQVHRERERRLAEVEGSLGAMGAGQAEQPARAPRDGAGARRAPDPEQPQGVAAQPPHPEGHVKLSEAGFEELRALGMSVTQAKRVIRHRNANGGFKSVDELDEVPGFPRIFLADLKRRLAP